MQVWKQVQAHIEAHFNRALLLSILACLVILLTYLLGGAGAFVALRQMLFPGAPASALTTSTGSSPGSTTTAKSTATTSSGQSGQTPTVVRSALTITLQVSPLDLPLNCALGASGAQVVTLRNPDSAAHHFMLGWNGTSGSASAFVATVVDGGPANTVSAHGTRLVSVAVVPLSLNPNVTSQYLWVSDGTGGTASVVAKVHVWCATLPVPTVTLPPVP